MKEFNKVQFHTKFLPLLRTKHTFANIYGGRGGMKSEQTHKIALWDAIKRPLRTCCARETMASIRDSSHKLLSDAIYAYEMAASQNGPYEIQESRILRKDGDQVASEFIFVGIRENVRDQKSLKGINRTIIEEAAKISQDSLEVFIPTVVREEGAQAWFIWNPELTTDPVYKYFFPDPPTNTIHINTSYLENPWLSETMRQLAEDQKRKDIKKYEHIWLGAPISEIEGAIFSDQLKAADALGTWLGSVPYDPTKPVDTAWDLGFGDATCIWFIQRRDGFLCFIDYLQDNNKTITDLLIALQGKGYMYGEDHLPHDAVDGIIHKRLIANPDKTKSIESIMRGAGRKVRIAPKLLKSDTLNFGRSLFPLCRFDNEKCADGIQALRHYQWDRTELEPGKRKPLHDQYSHGADAFLTAAVSIKRESHQAPVAPSRAVKRETVI